MQLRTEIEINADPQEIWDVLTDAERYHEWNPLITTLEGQLGLGEILTVVVSPPESSDFRFKPRVVEHEAGHRLAWESELIAAWLFKGRHFFELLQLGPERTRFVHGEDFSGCLVKFMMPQLGRTARGFAFMNQALKRRVEEGVSAKAARGRGS